MHSVRLEPLGGWHGRRQLQSNGERIRGIGTGEILFDLSESRTVTSNATPKMTESTAASRTVARTAPQTAPIVVATQRNRPIRMFEMPSRK